MTKDGWVRGALTGAAVGASAVAVWTAMNRGARKRMIHAVTSATQKMADKAEQLTR